MNSGTGKYQAAQVAAVVTVLMLCAYAVGHKTPEMRSCTGPTLEQIALNPTPPKVSEAELDALKTTPAVAAEPGIVTGAADDEEDKVRQVARDFVKQKYPGAKCDGVSAIPFLRQHLYIAGVDTTVDGNRSTIDLLLRSYTRRNGSKYWLASSLSGEEAARLRAQAVSDR